MECGTLVMSRIRSVESSYRMPGKAQTFFFLIKVHMTQLDSHFKTFWEGKKWENKIKWKRGGLKPRVAPLCITPILVQNVLVHLCGVCKLTAGLLNVRVQHNMNCHPGTVIWGHCELELYGNCLCYRPLNYPKRGLCKEAPGTLRIPELETLGSGTEINL